MNREQARRGLIRIEEHAKDIEGLTEEDWVSISSAIRNLQDSGRADHMKSMAQKRRMITAAQNAKQEGYTKGLIDGANCVVEEMEEWLNTKIEGCDDKGLTSVLEKAIYNMVIAKLELVKNGAK